MTAFAHRPLAIVLASALLAAGSPTQAQEGQAVFREAVEVEIVNVEVVVTDKAGVPVTGLTAEDFRVLEDGQEVEIANFYEIADESIEANATDATATPTPEASAPAPRPAGSTQQLSLVAFVDNLNILPSNRKLIFDNLREYLRSGAPVIDQVMVISMQNRVEVVQPFTDDLEAVFDGLETIEGYTSYQATLEGEQKIFLSRLQRAATPSPAGGGPSLPGGGSVGVRCGGATFEDAIRVALDLGITTRSIAERRYSGLRASVSAISAFVSTLGGLPGRKALLYISDGLSVRPNDMLREAWAEKYESWYLTNETPIRNCASFPDASGVFQRLITGLGSSQFSLHDDFDRLTAHASDNQIVIYPISASGRASGIITAEGSGSTGAVLRAARLTEAQNRDASMLQMADDTGGVALTSTANIGRLLDQVSSDFSNFYSLGFTPMDTKRDVNFHRFKVEVTHPGLEVRHAKGRLRKSWRDRLGDVSAAAALFAIETNPLGILLTPGEHVQKGKRSVVPIMVQIPFAKVQMVSDGTNYTAELTVLVTVSDEDGGISEPQRYDLPIQIPNAQILAARQQAAGFPLELSLEPGRSQIAVAVRDHLAQAASVVSIPVEVEGAKSKGKKRKKRKG